MNTSYSMTSKHQVTIPKSVREKLKIGERARLTFKEEGNKVYIEKAPTIEEIRADLQADMKRRGVKSATNREIKNARSEFYKQGMTWED